MSNELDVLVEKTTQITIAGKPYHIGKLSFKQIIELSRFFVSIAGKLKNGVALADNNIADFIFLIQALENEEGEVEKLFSILLKEPDIDFIKKHVTENFELCTDIVAAVCEHNDFKKMFANFHKAAESMKQAEPVSQPS
jgi:hypothetical protein